MFTEAGSARCSNCTLRDLTGRREESADVDTKWPNDYLLGMIVQN